MMINKQKPEVTKSVRANNKRRINIMFQGFKLKGMNIVFQEIKLEEADEFCYLGNVIKRGSHSVYCL